MKSFKAIGNVSSVYITCSLYISKFKNGKAHVSVPDLHMIENFTFPIAGLIIFIKRYDYKLMSTLRKERVSKMLLQRIGNEGTQSVPTQGLAPGQPRTRPNSSNGR